MVRYLCQIAGVSRSGYYNYFSAISQSRREKRTHQDEMVKEMIVRAFRFKTERRGSSDQNDIGGSISSCLQFETHP